jgi:hypothetical protein
VNPLYKTASEQIAGERTVRTRESALQHNGLERFHVSSHAGSALVRLVMAGLLAVMTAPAIATPAAAAPADQVAGLFMQACLPYAGMPAQLRAWAAENRLKALPDPARAAFLHGAPGAVFDASNATGKLVVVSSDDGICSVVTDLAPGQRVVDALEENMRRAGIAFRMVIERDDRQVAALHDREYLAARNGIGWRILAATVKDAPEGQAMLTAAPEVKAAE